MIYPLVEKFLKKNCPSTEPLLLALSGGPDSLALFYCLLEYRKRNHLDFHIAHIDHGWRKESQDEAEALEKLAKKYEVPFHLKKLDISNLKGNLEDLCRRERYAFFALLSKQHHFQAVLTGHHFNDRAETIFKRILEGAHWSHWSGMKPISHMHGIPIFRPLIDIPKKMLEEALAKEGIVPFEDPTNKQEKFLRARLRESIFPRLNQEFGKEIQNSLIEIGNESLELNQYFEELIAPYLKQRMSGPIGICLNLEENHPHSLLETKYLLRYLCRLEGIVFSRQIIELAAQALLNGKANQRFAMGNREMMIDRKKVFILRKRELPTQNLTLSLSVGSFQFGRWKVDCQEAPYQDPENSSWRDGWLGSMKCSLPLKKYHLFLNHSPQKLRKIWSQAKIPSFLTSLFPFIKDPDDNYYEFLTGKTDLKLKVGDPCLKILLTYEADDPNVKN